MCIDIVKIWFEIIYWHFFCQFLTELSARVTVIAGYYRFRFYLDMPMFLLSHFLRDHWAHCGILENGVLLMYIIEGVSSAENFITAYEDF